MTAGFPAGNFILKFSPSFSATSESYSPLYDVFEPRPIKATNTTAIQLYAFILSNPDVKLVCNYEFDILLVDRLATLCAILSSLMELIQFSIRFQLEVYI